MKRLLMILALLTGLMSCGFAENAASAKAPQKNRVEVIYFHGKQRCVTCMAIEKNTREVLTSMFAKELKSGKVVFKVVDISTPAGEKLADKYEVTWSSLFVNRWKNGNETRSNMKDFGFGNARKNPAVFKRGLANKIQQSLK